MAVSFQLVIDCADPEPLARFWAAALGYELEPPPDGFASWDAYRRDLGVPEDELGTGADCIVDPGGRGPRIWFQVVPERKAARNRLHLDIGVSGGRAVPIETRRQRAGAEAGRLAGLGAGLAGVLNTEGLDHSPWCGSRRGVSARSMCWRLRLRWTHIWPIWGVAGCAARNSVLTGRFS